MKRLPISVLISVALIATAAGCRDRDDCNLGYCDDSGCYDCDGFPIPNNPCQGQEQCESDEICTQFGCSQVCSHDSDCGLGEVCLPEGYCGPAEPAGSECENDDDCNHGMICEDNVCVEGCQSDDDCQSEGEGWVCASCGRCQPPDSPTCGETKTYCTDSDQCGDGRTCTTLKFCAYECNMSDPLCPRGQICQDSVCVDDPDPQSPECVFSADCGSQTHCQDLGCLCVNSYCRPMCASVEDCGWGEICDLGLCVANYRPEE